MKHVFDEMQGFKNLNKKQRSQLSDIFLTSALAFSLLILQSLLSLPNLDITLSISAILFSIAIPMLAGAIISKYPHQLLARSTNTLSIIGLLSAFFATCFDLFHLSPIACITFFISTNIAAGIILKDQRLYNYNTDQQKVAQALGVNVCDLIEELPGDTKPKV